MVMKDWKKIVNKKGQKSYEKKDKTLSVTIFKNYEGEWKGRYFERGSARIKWEPSNPFDFESEKEAMQWIKKYIEEN